MIQRYGNFHMLVYFRNFHQNFQKALPGLILLAVSNVRMLLLLNFTCSACQIIKVNLILPQPLRHPLDLFFPRPTASYCGTKCKPRLADRELIGKLDPSKPNAGFQIKALLLPRHKFQFISGTSVFSQNNVSRNVFRFIKSP